MEEKNSISRSTNKINLKKIVDKRTLKKKLIYIRNNRLLYFMLLIPIAYYIVFRYVPMYGVQIAFKDYSIFRGYAESPWVGFEVFEKFLKMKDFSRALRNTLILNVTSLVIGFPAPIILALMLNEVYNTKLKKAVQSVLYIPHFISMVIIAGILKQLLAFPSGTINSYLVNWGFEGIPFLTNNFWWVVTYVGSGIWQSAGWGTIIYLAAISGLDPQVFEAATVDGCGKLQKIWYITLPGIKPTIVLLLILSIGGLMGSSFDKPYLLGNVIVKDVSDVIATFVYRVGLQNANYSVATAVGLFQSVINFILIFSANQISKRLGENGIW